MVKIILIIGTRPEIIKCSEVIHRFNSKPVDFLIINTFQHFDKNMGSIFYDEFNINRIPRMDLGNSSSDVDLMGKKLTSILTKESPDLVIVHGDTNSALAGALSAENLDIPVAHIEAGLRCFNRDIIEETNRIRIDHLSNLLFCPTEKEHKNLVLEGIRPDKICITGNTIVDVINHNEKKISNSSILSDLKLKHNSYLLLTLHRKETTENIEIFRKILHKLNEAAVLYGLPILVSNTPKDFKNHI